MRSDPQQGFRAYHILRLCSRTSPKCHCAPLGSGGGIQAILRRSGCRTILTAIPASQPLFSAFVTTPAHACGRATDPPEGSKSPPLFSMANKRRKC